MGGKASNICTSATLNVSKCDWQAVPYWPTPVELITITLPNFPGSELRYVFSIVNKIVWKQRWNVDVGELGLHAEKKGQNENSMPLGHILLLENRD